MERSVPGGWGDTHSSHEKFVALIEIEVRVRVKSFPPLFPNQSNDVMVEHVEGKALSEVLLEIRVEEVVPPLEEIPSVVKLDSPQPGEALLFILGAERIVGSCCREDCNSAHGTCDE